jgi:hypothetical protein
MEARTSSGVGRVAAQGTPTKPKNSLVFPGYSPFRPDKNPSSFPNLPWSTAYYSSGTNDSTTPIAKEGFTMDPHFNEYLAAVAGMAELYGEPCPDTGSEFHEDVPCVGCPGEAVAAA